MAADGFGFNDNERMRWDYDQKDPSKGSWQFVESYLSTLVSIGDAPVSIGYRTLAWYPL
jgi:hypothetical protein